MPDDAAPAIDPAAAPVAAPDLAPVTSGQPMGDGGAAPVDAQPPVDYQTLASQREEQLQAAMQELDQVRSTWNGLDPQAARAAVAAQEASGRHQQDPFAADHPQLSRHQDSVRRAGAFLSAIEAIPEDQRKLYGPGIAKRLGVTQADLQIHDQFQRRRETFERELYENPDSFVQSRIQAAVADVRESVMKEVFARINAGKWGDSHGDMLKTHAGRILPLVDPTAPYQQRVEGIGGLLDQIAKLQAQLGQSAQGNATASARDAIVANAPRAARSGGAAPAYVDATDYVKQKFPGLKPGTPAWSAKIIDTQDAINEGRL